MIDSHAHLDDKKFKNLDEIILKARNSGVKAVIDPATSFASNFKILQLSEKYSGFVFPALGIDPLNSNISQQQLEEVKELIIEKKPVAIGEVGLDYYWLKEKEPQQKVFEFFIKLAEELKLPLIVHARKAEKEVIDLLKNSETAVIMHHFSGTLEQAEACVYYGFYVSLATNCCYSNCEALIEKIPLESMLLETDSPYNHPDRKGINEPANIKKLYDLVSRVKEQEFKEVEKVIDKNAKRVFKLGD